MPKEKQKERRRRLMLRKKRLFYACVACWKTRTTRRGRSTSVKFVMRISAWLRRSVTVRKHGRETKRKETSSRPL